MADEFQIRSGNWWDPSRFNGPSSSSTSFGWSSMDSVSVSGSSSVFGDTQKFQRSDSSVAGGVLAADPNLQMMGLGLSSQSMDWNQSLHGSGKPERSFHSLLQEDHMSSNKNYNQESGISSSSISQDQWTQKINSTDSDDSLASDFMRTKRGLSLDQPQFVSQDNTTFQMDSAVYGSSSSTMFKGLFGSDDHPQQSGFENVPTMNFPYQSSYVMNSGEPVHGQLQFTNNAPFWNASMATMNNLQSSFFSSSLPTPFTTPTFEEKPKNPSQLQDLGTVGKKSNNEPSTKRARSETSSTVPAFNKVRKEKVSDRITALQQLVSPFGKTDTASVLSEAIEYIKFLHEQVNVLSIPYMKSGASIQHQQSSKKPKDPEGPKQDLRTRGLCLVPVSSTFPVTQETTVDHFWTPTFGSTYR